MSSVDKTGRIRVTVFGQDYSATWRVIGTQVEITSKFGVCVSPLGGLSSAPGTAAQEKFRDVVKQNTLAPKKPVGDRARFNVRDA